MIRYSSKLTLTKNVKVNRNALDRAHDSKTLKYASILIMDVSLLLSFDIDSCTAIVKNTSSFKIVGLSAAGSLLCHIVVCS